MYVGGYVMIDMTGIDVSVATKQTKEDIFRKAAGASSSMKAVQLTNLVNAGYPVSPVEVVITGDGNENEIVALSPDKTFTFTSDDGVVIDSVR